MSAGADVVDDTIYVVVLEDAGAHRRVYARMSSGRPLFVRRASSRLAMRAHEWHAEMVVRQLAAFGVDCKLERAP